MGAITWAIPTFAAYDAWTSTLWLIAILTMGLMWKETDKGQNMELRLSLCHSVSVCKQQDKRLTFIIGRCIECSHNIFQGSMEPIHLSAAERKEEEKGKHSHRKYPDGFLCRYHELLIYKYPSRLLQWSHSVNYVFKHISIRGLICSTLDHRSLPTEFKSRRGHIGGCFIFHFASLPLEVARPI